MRIAVISDIHGNDIALEAVLADIGRASVDRIVCLGDAIQGGPQPGEVVGRLRDLGCPVVMGNADAWLLTGDETGDEPITDDRRRVLDAVRAWSLTQLAPDDRAFIAGFRPTVEIELGAGRRLLCFHGSPRSFDDVILPETADAEVRGWLGGDADRVLTGGHTHLQQIRRLGDSFFFNPGSVGFAFDRHRPKDRFRADHWADHAILTVDGPRIALEFRRVPFDVAALIAAYRTSGRPFAERAIAEYGGG